MYSRIKEIGSFGMKRLTVEFLNSFLERTSIHGLSYLTKDEAKCTRFIWTLIVLTASGIAGYLLYNTVVGFDEHYTSTTIETASIQNYPFPAVTFHPGDFNLENSLSRTLLNQLEFTRFNKGNHLRNNEQFMRQFRWLVSPMNNELFERVEKYLLSEERFLKYKGRMVEKQSCMLVALYNKKISPRNIVPNFFLKNMYKFNGFEDPLKLIKGDLNKEILNVVNSNNVSKAEISRACKDKVKVL